MRCGIHSGTARRNKITQDGGVALARLLQYNTPLSSLDLRANAVADEGALALAKALERNRNLTRYAVDSIIFPSVTVDCCGW